MRQCVPQTPRKRRLHFDDSLFRRQQLGWRLIRLPGELAKLRFKSRNAVEKHKLLLKNARVKGLSRGGVVAIPPACHRIIHVTPLPDPAPSTPQSRKRIRSPSGFR